MVSVSEFMFVLYDVRLFKQRHGKIERLLILEVDEGTSSNLGVHAEGVEQRRLRQKKYTWLSYKSFLFPQVPKRALLASNLPPFCL